MIGFIVFIICMAALSGFIEAMDDMSQLIAFILAFTASYRYVKRLIAARKAEKERDYRQEIKDEVRQEVLDEMSQLKAQQQNMAPAATEAAEGEPYYPEKSYFHQ